MDAVKKSPPRALLSIYGLLLLLLIMSSPITNANTIIADRFTDKLSITSSLELAADANRSILITDIDTPDSIVSFAPIAKTGSNLGFTSTPYWIRFTLHQNEKTPPLLLEFANPRIDNIELYLPQSDGSYHMSEAGESKPFVEREYQFRNFMFELPNHPGESRTYYLRMDSEGSIQVSLYLWSYDAFIQYLDNSNLLLGAYYGIMILLMMVAAAFYLKLRDPLFLTYSLYLLTYIIFQLSLNGLSYQYLWPELSEYSGRLTAASVGFVGIGGYLFAGGFLRIWQRHSVQLITIVAFLISLDSLGIVMSLFGDYALGVKLSTLAGLSLPPVILFAAISSWRSGYRPARYFLMAWIIFLFGIFIAGLLYFGLVPQTFLTLYSIQIGSIIEVILLGYALIDRAILRQAQKVKIGELKGESLEQKNLELEQLVQARTHELEENNIRLKKLSLQDSMTGLLTHNATIDLLEQQLHIAVRYIQPLSVIMLDIDDFKKVNDRFGHLAGDGVIINIAKILKACMREADYCGRYGGEEFILILPATDIWEAAVVAERIRQRVTELKLIDINNQPLSASFGVSEFNQESSEVDLILQADKALYRAKQKGKNCVVTDYKSSIEALTI
ncbi:sensor domain-containing diguanylate cyclase [Amphritea japonica]|uniref:diguanylate cyclase n=1 Tax=Amphritea japonica ATCC BAA-1530 TaxID=1278309 RepID=A0A7R6P4M1_9GAMM|nr:diguanylate cyclase [Amphritea japonica]BBB27079.1 signal transduction protein [Amphritea japonica ATCC BAA-1530]